MANEKKPLQQKVAEVRKTVLPFTFCGLNDKRLPLESGNLQHSLDEVDHAHA